MIFGKPEKVVCLMGSMTVINQEDGSPRRISCFCLQNKVVLEPFQAMEIACPPIVGKSNAISM